MSIKPQHLSHQLSKPVQLGYLLHLPSGYTRATTQRWPVILFLHGYGQSGDDLEQLYLHGLPKHSAAQPDFPFVTVMPQCPWGTWWPELADSLDALLDLILTNYSVDPTRVYLTGLSMGGFGSWYLAATRPQRFAAVAPICGGGMWFHGFPDKVQALKNTPVWAFHGAKDSIVPVAETEKLVQKLKDCGGNVRCTIYPELDHDSWSVTYDNPALYDWFLSHQLRQRT